MKFQKHIDIASPAETIWPILVNPSNVMRWCGAVRRIHPTSSQNSGVGGTFYFEERAAGRLLKLHFVVTDWEVNRRFGFKLISGNVLKGYEQKYTLEPHPIGTRLTCFEHVVFPLGFMGKAAGLIRKPISIALVKRNLVNLKGLGES